MGSEKIVTYIGLFLLLSTTSVAAVTILASDFNKKYSCKNPFIATETTIIILNEDISVEGVCELIKAGGGFDSENDRIIFTSSTSNRVVITQESTWKLGLVTQFTGDAHLEKEPGATLWLMNTTTLFLSGNSRYITIPTD